MYKPKVTKENPIVNKRFLIDNGYDYFFEDDGKYGFKDVESGMFSMIRIAKDTECEKCKLIHEIILKNDDYIQKVISTYNPNNLWK